MTPRQLEILQHTLGVDELGQGEQYRNHFCAGGDDQPVCEELVVLGYMEVYGLRAWIPYTTYGVTESGKKAMAAESTAPPRLTRSQKRYRAFLDADNDMTFFEWMKAVKS